MKSCAGRGREHGLTLIEMLFALVVFGLVMGTALGYFRSQLRGFRLGGERMDALQNVRFAANFSEAHLRVAGAGVPDQQPFLVYAGPDVVAFNADYVTNVANDVFAVYHDPDAPTGAVTALTSAQRFVLPLTAFAYPDTTYADPAGVNSPAETLVLFFAPDSSTPRPDDYALFMQVNRELPELVSRNLLQTRNTPFFQYYRLQAPSGAPPRIEPVPLASLPLVHGAAGHLTAADTGAAAVIDSVRAVRLNITGTNGQTGTQERLRTISRFIRMANAGLASRRTCGDTPFPSGPLAVSTMVLATGESVATLSWGPSVDETGGEGDVVRYVLWRRLQSEPDWGDPYLSIPSGNASYVYTDGAVQSGQRFFYAIAAQDCTPSLSTLVTVGPVAIP